MKLTTAQRIRDWTGPALLTYGFRPFFFGAAVWAALAMVLWIGVLTGQGTLPTALDPVSWHAHEFLFGYLGAVVAGFLLTAVPNWTGRLPIVGWPLAGLVALWLAGRAAMAVSAGLLPELAAVIDLSFSVVLAAIIAREIVAGKNWRNLIVLGMLCVMILGNGVFHWEVAKGSYAAQGYGLRLGLAAGIMMIAVIGGRIVPSFTRNWLVKRGATRLPVPPMQVFDRLALLGLMSALLLWVALPTAFVTGATLLIAGALHVGRLFRWAGAQTLSEPLVWVLHAGYAFVPLGALAIGAEVLLGTSVSGAVQHLWMGGALGLTTLAVMTRATLGHTGQELTAGPGTVGIYGAMIAAVLLRVAAGLWPQHAAALHSLSGPAWIASFAGFSTVYGPLLLCQRSAKAA
ncbi:NnrS family protein [Lutimaribacter marinistellae]|uniref:NnrS family protein n=1 Tax=Lutimaribacter marinistellae TaxID=1820329 RepID=A0ABV7TIC2_9RHOB